MAGGDLAGRQSLVHFGESFGQFGAAGGLVGFETAFAGCPLDVVGAVRGPGFGRGLFGEAVEGHDDVGLDGVEAAAVRFEVPQVGAEFVTAAASEVFDVAACDQEVLDAFF